MTIDARARVGTMARYCERSSKDLPIHRTTKDPADNKEIDLVVMKMTEPG